MSDVTNDLTNSDTNHLGHLFDQSLHAYGVALDALHTETPPKAQTILNVLLARDSIQALLDEGSDRPTNVVLRIAELDDLLKKQGNTIADNIDLDHWRELLTPPESQWWWFFEPSPKPVKKDLLDKLDWVWNLGSLLCLTGFVTYMTQVVPIVFSNGLNVFESIGLAGPGGLLAVALSSLNGGDGRKKIQETLTAVGIPSRFQSEATFTLALVLFLGSYAARTYLPDHYFAKLIKEGAQYYNEGNLEDARAAYKSSLTIPDQDAKKISNVYNAFGKIDESVGNSRGASTQYQKALDAGSVTALNNLGRVYIDLKDLDMAQTFLIMALPRVKTLPNGTPEEQQEKINVNYQVHRNLGWIYLEKKQYANALVELNIAVEFDKSIPVKNQGKGIANCFKAKVFEDLQALNPQDQQQAFAAYDKLRLQMLANEDLKLALTAQQMGDALKSYQDIFKSTDPKQAFQTRIDTQWKNCQEFGYPETLAEYRSLLKIKPEIARNLDTKGIFN